MPRNVFFSFHYQRDVFRINQIRNIPEIIGSAAAGFRDASLWEEAKREGDAVVMRMIDRALENTSITVVFIGAATTGRKFINYEIEQSLKRGNGLVGMQIHHLIGHDKKPDVVGTTPPQIERAGFKTYKYVNVEKLANRIEEAALIAGK